MVTADRTWRSNGAKEGLYVSVYSDHGGEIRVATHDDAERLIGILNSLEEGNAFGQQCLQDNCENAYVEQTVLKTVEESRQDLLGALQAAYATFYDPKCELGLRVGTAIKKAKELRACS